MEKEIKNQEENNKSLLKKGVNFIKKIKSELFINHKTVEKIEVIGNITYFILKENILSQYTDKNEQYYKKLIDYIKGSLKIENGIVRNVFDWTLPEIINNGGDRNFIAGSFQFGLQSRPNVELLKYVEDNNIPYYNPSHSFYGYNITNAQYAYRPTINSFVCIYNNNKSNFITINEDGAVWTTNYQKNTIELINSSKKDTLVGIICYPRIFKTIEFFNKNNLGQLIISNHRNSKNNNIEIIDLLLTKNRNEISEKDKDNIILYIKYIYNIDQEIIFTESLEEGYTRIELKDNQNKEIIIIFIIKKIRDNNKTI